MVSFNITEGNPGCLQFLIDAYDKYMFFAERGFQRMQDAGVKGSRLYMLWNDCCDRDTSKALYIMLNRDVDDIIHHIDGGSGRGIPIQEEKRVEDLWEDAR